MAENNQTEATTRIKYGTYLPAELVQRLKVAAIKEGRNDYQIVEVALIEYLARLEAHDGNK